MKTIKETIIEQSKKLFNEKGYYQVTMRDIAREANTTLGNLTYHFRRKEDLVLEIQKDAHGDLLHVLEERLKKREAHTYRLAEIFDVFVSIEKTEKEYSYYFNNLMELGRDYPEICSQQRYIRNVFLQYYLTAFLTLQQKGVFRADISTERYHSLARTFIMLMTIWNQNGSPAYDDAFQNHRFFVTCSDDLYPFLTEQGQREYLDYFSGLC